MFLCVRANVIGPSIWSQIWLFGLVLSCEGKEKGSEWSVVGFCWLRLDRDSQECG